MHVEYGPYKGRTVTFVFLKHPDFVLDTLMPKPPTLSRRPVFENREFPPKPRSTEPPVDPERKEALAIEFRGLMPIFDAKPIIKKPCLGRNCEKKATRLSICRDNIDMVRWWCEDCDPCQLGADRDRIQILRTYMDVLMHIQQFCNRRRWACKELVGEIARAKGLPKSYNEARAAKFFAE